MSRDYQAARPVIATLLNTLRLPNIGAITPRQLNRLYRALGWESDDMQDERKGKKNLLMWIRKNVDGMDVEKGSRVGWDRKIDDSVCLREEELEKDDSGGVDGDDTDGDEGHDGEGDSKIEQDGRKSGGKGGKTNADLLDVHNNDILTPGWDPSSATMACLRNMLTTYSVAFPSSATKSALVELVTVKLLPTVNHSRRQNARVLHSSREGPAVRDIGNEDVSTRSKDEKRRQVEKRQKHMEVVDLDNDSRIPLLSEDVLAEDVNGTNHVVEMDVMEDLQHDILELPQGDSPSQHTKLPQDDSLSQHNDLCQNGPCEDDATLQAQLARATQNRDELINVCLEQQEMVTLLKGERATLQTQLEFTFSRAQNEIEQLRKEKVDLEVQLESTALRQVELDHLYQENADLQNRLGVTIKRCDEEKADLKNQLRSSMQRQNEHTDLQARLQKQLETAKADHERRHSTMQDQLDQLQSTIHSQAADLSVFRTKDNFNVTGRSNTWNTLPVLRFTGSKRDGVEPLHAILVTVLQRARAGEFSQCFDGIADTMKIVGRMSMEKQAVEERVAQTTGNLSSAEQNDLICLMD
ncbi:unnamed protein product [Zymoseptoria tritici ST99CH_1E4]|uniref:HeH/LEM domain-containing protein n=1 Tax=Zymoseptoria tritici ST99CH_1E4 TaxID=1276532 RepID=A0A2H1H9P4_ZYMTR|nr:unnamed protein product [Zymoseptoria tritici ST99CH_1E4]